ncbi:DNA topoisomerase 2, partial [Monoraphidium neglectum]
MGLGTSDTREAKEYFAALDSHRKQFVWEGDEDGQAIEMAFSKKRVEDRKKWLSGFVPGTYLDQSVDTISYSDFVHKARGRSTACRSGGQELILFSRADLERSIPCLVDGLKPGQRKIMFCAFKRNLKKDIKDFVGSNNINLLFPSGQFGTRLQGGKDAASARYVYTRLAPLARHVFNAADDKLLDYLTEEGQSIEP